MDRSKLIQVLKKNLSRLAELEREFPNGPSALNIRSLREEFEGELLELEKSPIETPQNSQSLDRDRGG
jgi:hypothetical protein